MEPFRGGRVLAAMAGVAMLGAGGMTALSAAAQQTAEPVREPQFIYERTCGYCHGHNVGPVIRGRKLPAAVISSFVRSGNGAMPAFKPTEISDAELSGLARWISESAADPKEHGQ
ncbi:c-type cytochrome [Croceibacterium xixiisoli]|nr:cytochrome c [Croceibacterium xixiisoli]